jgi:hypothetical protein
MSAIAPAPVVGRIVANSVQAIAAASAAFNLAASHAAYSSVSSAGLLFGSVGSRTAMLSNSFLAARYRLIAVMTGSSFTITTVSLNDFATLLGR